MHRIYTALLTLLLFASPLAAQTVAPFMGLGSVQSFDNNGKTCTACVIYSFQAGTTMQQATFTSALGTAQNPNPITFASGARASIWLSIGSFYKFILCAQNDGPTCAPADVLFSVDQVPGGSSSSSGGTSPFTGTFISGTASPASSGILRLASGDTVCFRNQAGSANLCLSKDTTDILSWPSALKIQQIAAPTGQAGFGILWADNSNRWKMSSNGGANFFIPGIAAAATANHVATFAANGLDIQDGGTFPASPEQVISWCTSGGCVGSATFTESNGFGFETRLTATHTLIRFTYNLIVSPSGCSTAAIVGVQDVSSSTNLTTSTISNGASTGYVDSGALSVAMGAGDKFMVGVTQGASGCATQPQIANLTAVYQ